MKKKTMEIISQFVIPVSTFVLGIIVTISFENYKRSQDRKAEISKEINQNINSNVDKICELTNDWYNQLYDLNVNFKYSKDSLELQKQIYFYSQSRLILPKIVKSLGVLKQYKSCDTFVSNVENFLGLVTNYQKDNNIELLSEYIDSSLVADTKDIELKDSEADRKNKYLTCKTVYKDIKEQLLYFDLEQKNKIEKISLELTLKKLDFYLQQINHHAGQYNK